MFELEGEFISVSAKGTESRVCPDERTFLRVIYACSTQGHLLGETFRIDVPKWIDQNAAMLLLRRHFERGKDPIDCPSLIVHSAHQRPSAPRNRLAMERSGIAARVEAVTPGMGVNLSALSSRPMGLWGVSPLYMNQITG